MAWNSSNIFVTTNITGEFGLFLKANIRLSVEDITKNNNFTDVRFQIVLSVKIHPCPEDVLPLRQ